MDRRLSLPAALAVVLVLVGQLLAYAHHASERHVTCAEHGDELDAIELAGPSHACDQDHWLGVDGDQGGGHDACPIQRVLRQGGAAPATWISLPLPAQIALADTPAAPRVPRPPRAPLQYAPKTSPPA